MLSAQDHRWNQYTYNTLNANEAVLVVGTGWRISSVVDVSTWTIVPVSGWKRSLSGVGNQLGNLVAGVVGVETKWVVREQTILSRYGDSSWELVVVQMDDFEWRSSCTWVRCQYLRIDGDERAQAG